jgi:hypothetical protein
MKFAMLTVTIASLIIANTANAQLGWTLEQCKAKFSGEPEIENVLGKTRATFSNADYVTIIDFDGGKVSSLLYGPRYENKERAFKNIISEVVAVSPEVSSWYQSYINGIKGTYGGISWGENETLSDKDGVYFVGSKSGKVVMSVCADSGGGFNIENLTASYLEEQIAETKKENEEEGLKKRL